MPHRRGRDAVAPQDPPDRRRADAVAELEQLAPEPQVAPARVLLCHPHYQDDENVVDRWSPGPLRIGPSSAHKAAMPSQDRVGCDQAMATQDVGQPPHERGEDGSVSPVHARTWVGPAEHSDFVAQHEKLDVLGGGGASEQ